MLAGVILAGQGLALQAAAQTPTFDRGLTSIEIPYANGPVRMEHTPEVWLKLPGAEPRRFGMDTGSTGLVVSEDHYTPRPGDVQGGPGRLVYNSSGRVLHGTFWTTDIEIMHSRERRAATARIELLRVDRITCLERARHCEPRERPRGVSYMGIGFHRGGAQGTDGTPATAQRNPFLALTALADGRPASSIRPGYVLTRTAVHLGVTAELARPFSFVKLTSAGGTDAGGLPLWNGAPLTVSVNGVTGTGNSLMDTGIDYMFLSPPPGANLTHGRPAPEGTRIEIWLPSQAQPAAAYAFTVGDWSSPMQPAKVEVVRDPGVFVNTGRQFLQGYDYLYDAQGGYVGYARR